MSTCPMAALGPPRDPPDTTHGVGVTNRPPTNVNLPNGRIRPSKKSPRYRHMEWEGQIGHQPMSTCPMAALGPPRNPQKSWIPKKSQRGKVDSYLIPYQMAHSTLIKRGQAQGCSSMDITQHHCSVKARSTSASHLDIPEEPIMLAHLPNVGPP